MLVLMLLCVLAFESDMKGKSVIKCVCVCV